MQGRRTERHWVYHEDGTRHKKIYICGSTVIAVSYLLDYDTLYNIRKILLQNATITLLQNARKTHYEICQVIYDKIQGFYYKL